MVSSLKSEKRLQEQMNAELVREYNASNKVVGKSVEKQVKSFPTRFVSMAMCLTRSILK